jgi:AmmeMemoRadiSam system protein B
MDRHSRHAGSWYAGTQESLQNQIHDLFLSEWGYGKDPLKAPEERTFNQDILGIVSPHAGYVYSGPIASHGYAEVYKNFEYLDTVVVLGPNHSGVGAAVSFYPEGKWHNPLGAVEIDTNLIDFAQSYDFGDIQNRVGFESSAHLSEHSIDIQLPFLQYLYEKNPFKFVPICLWDQSYSPTIKGLAKFLQAYIKAHSEKKNLIIASSDFSHEYNYDLAVKNDKTMLSHLEKPDLSKAEEFRKEVSMTMCGYGPVFALIKTAELLGTPSVNVLKYANSSDIRSGGGYTVGYASITVKTQN